MPLPILASEFLWSLGQNVESAVYGHIGTASLAAYTLTCPIQELVVGALSGLSAAAGVMVGKRLGRKEYDEAYRESGRIMKAGLLGAALISALLILLAGAYTDLYRVDREVKAIGKALLIVFALYAPAKVENMILGGGIIRSGGRTGAIILIDTVGTWCLGIPLCLFAAHMLHWGDRRRLCAAHLGGAVPAGRDARDVQKTELDGQPVALTGKRGQTGHAIGSTSYAALDGGGCAIFCQMRAHEFFHISPKFFLSLFTS